MEKNLNIISKEGNINVTVSGVTCNSNAVKVYGTFAGATCIVTINQCTVENTVYMKDIAEGRRDTIFCGTISPKFDGGLWLIYVR